MIDIIFWIGFRVNKFSLIYDYEEQSVNKTTYYLFLLFYKCIRDYNKHATYKIIYLIKLTTNKWLSLNQGEIENLLQYGKYSENKSY